MGESSKKAGQRHCYQVPAWHCRLMMLTPACPYPRSSCGGWKKDLIQLRRSYSGGCDAPRLWNKEATAQCINWSTTCPAAPMSETNPGFMKIAR